MLVKVILPEKAVIPTRYEVEHKLDNLNEKKLAVDLPTVACLDQNSKASGAAAVPSPPSCRFFLKPKNT
jgi:hypothetical protein